MLYSVPARVWRGRGWSRRSVLRVWRRRLARQSRTDWFWGVQVVAPSTIRQLAVMNGLNDKVALLTEGCRGIGGPLDLGRLIG